MEFNLTLTIKNLLEDLIGGKWGRLIGKNYLQFASLFNFLIILGVGELISMLIPKLFFLDFVVKFLWLYLNTVGPLRKMWGFGVQPQKMEEDKEEKDSWKL